MPEALITGITGQDGSYLAEFLLTRGYEDHGIKRRSSSFTTGRVDHIYQDAHEVNNRLFLHHSDLTDASSLAALTEVKPDEIYSLGAQGHVKVPLKSRVHQRCGGHRHPGTAGGYPSHGPKCRFYQASPSEMLGATPPPKS